MKLSLLKVKHEFIDQTKNSKHHYIELIKDLTDGEYAEIKSNIKIMNELKNTEELFILLVRNNYDIAKLIFDLAQLYLAKEPKPESVKGNFTFDFCRCLLNLMNSFKTIIDFTKFNLSREYGNDSQEVRNWENLQKECFDTYFEYRFICKLRNFCQHIGMPPVRFNVKIENEVEVKIDIRFMKNELLIDKKVWGAKVYNEIVTYKEDLNLMEILDKWMDSILILKKYIVDIKRNKAELSAKQIMQYRNVYQIENDCEIVIGNIESGLTENKGGKLQMESLQEDLAFFILNGERPTTAST